MQGQHLEIREQRQPVRTLPPDPPTGVSAVVYGQIAALITNTTIQFFVLWIAIDAFARREYPQVFGLALFSGMLFVLSLAVYWLG